MNYLSDETNMDDMSSDDIMTVYANDLMDMEIVEEEKSLTESSLTMILDNMMYLSDMCLKNEMQDKNNNKMSISNEQSKKLDYVQMYNIKMSNMKNKKEKNEDSMKNLLNMISETSLQDTYKKMSKKSSTSVDKMNLNKIMKDMKDKNINMKSKKEIKSYINSMM